MAQKRWKLVGVVAVAMALCCGCASTRLPKDPLQSEDLALLVRDLVQQMVNDPLIQELTNRPPAQRPTVELAKLRNDTSDYMNEEWEVIKQEVRRALYTRVRFFDPDTRRRLQEAIKQNREFVDPGQAKKTRAQLATDYLITTTITSFRDRGKWKEYRLAMFWIENETADPKWQGTTTFKKKVR